MKTRLPTFAGRFYPGKAKELETVVEQHLAAAKPKPLENVRAVIAPHAGYIYSGPIAGYAFKALQSSLPAGPATVYLLGPSHYPFFVGVATGDFDFVTPLGTIPTQQATLHALWNLGTHYQPLSQAHHDEHCLEVEVPFLQRTVPELRLVPLLFGQVDALAVGRELAGRLREEPNSRVVVSSDLSHRESYERAQELDLAFLEAVLNGDQAAVKRKERGACGRAPILALMEIAAQLDWTPHLLDYRNSGDTAGPKYEVVGYAAVAYTAEA